MSKRSTNTPIGHDAKKPKLHITRSDHPIPSSQQNSSFSIIQENECDVWGDDADDEILLQASQACDEESNDISILPDYSNWKQPASTSTQYQPSPSTSKASFEFKKPSSKLPASVHLKYKCNTISSPLPGISTMSHNRHPSITDDLAISDKIVSGDDSDVWRQLLLLEEENNKLKSEYGKLSDKVVTKEGEASILRSQLKASQLANDNARMDKIRAQERVQMECDEKMAAMTRELQSLKSQLEFKDLEILNVKDKFKKLEANKLRQNEILSHRNNNIVAGLNDGMTQQKKVQTTSSSIQTEDKAPFIKLNKYRRRGDFHTPTKKDGSSQLSEVLGSLRELKWELEAGAPADADEPQPDTLGPDVSLDRLRDVFPLYRGERGVAARLVLASLASELHPPLARDQWDHILTGATEICILIEKQACSTSYGGFLLALIELIGLHLIEEVEEPYDLQLVVCLMRCKPPPFLALKLLELAALPARAAWPCPRPSDIMDVDDETNSDVCCLPALLGQAEAALAAAARHRSGARARAALRHLSELLDRPQARSCSCGAALWRAFALALCCCVELLLAAPAAAERQRLESACRGGLARAAGGAWAARPAEGRLAHAAARLRTRYPDWPEQTELLNAFQTAAEEVAAPRISQPNITTFFETN